LGKITYLELKRVAQDLGEDMTDEEIEKMFAKADLDDDGFVTADDFYNIMTHRVYWDNWNDLSALNSYYLYFWRHEDAKLNWRAHYIEVQ